MKKISESVLPAIVVAILSLIGQLLWTEPLINTFRIYSTDSMSNQSRTLVNYLIVNQSDQNFDGLQLLVPSGVSVGDVKSSYPLIIKENVGTDSILMDISGIVARSSLLLSVEADNQDEIASIKFTNLETLGGKLYPSFGLQSVRFETFVPILLNALISGTVMGVLVFMVNWYMEKHITSYRHDLEISNKRMNELKEELKEQTEQRNNLVSKIEKELTQTKADIKETGRVYARQKKYLIATLGDSRRELEFWRSTIRALIMRGNQENPKEILDTVRSQLHTYRVANMPADLTKILVSLVTDGELPQKKIDIHSEA